MGFLLLADLNSSYIWLLAIFICVANTSDLVWWDNKTKYWGLVKIQPEKVLHFISHNASPCVGSVVAKACFSLLENSRFQSLNKSQITMNGLSLQFSINWDMEFHFHKLWLSSIPLCFTATLPTAMLFLLHACWCLKSVGESL